MLFFFGRLPHVSSQCSLSVIQSTFDFSVSCTFNCKALVLTRPLPCLGNPPPAAIPAAAPGGGARAAASIPATAATAAAAGMCGEARGDTGQDSSDVHSFLVLCLAPLLFATCFAFFLPAERWGLLPWNTNHFYPAAELPARFGAMNIAAEATGETTF